MTFQLRRAGVADLDAIMAIETSTFTTDAWSSSTMRADLASEHTYYLVAFPPDEREHIVGYAGLLAPRGGTDADIQTIAVVPEFRGQRLGRALMERLIDEARGRGVTEVFLEVRADNPVAQALYDTLGFVEIAVRPTYYQPDGVDAIVMRLSVQPARTTLAVGIETIQPGEAR
ncbi:MULTISPECIES: ribosomal protein S18-alanine N-acetyltransferase [unclassified Leifsonia]|uniref:ribosomal protein S18-alanine N-acetyltransferase n=1 Tax=unclassified Leifsonia TaxID=2663824 RepID=UPI0006F644F8|nr:MULTISPECIES: ribosomal protein S18-alanine N-acetyltransferase [unclassified Leifsonia]KQX07902.1 ribosomal-protein-alanine acetyltransferase [Leifsonia sp. Root1293]KRA12183.1 ribosomal-protein-alanine acetyltransferase [Leifsonia sp. Root60]